MILYYVLEKVHLPEDPLFHLCEVLFGQIISEYAERFNGEEKLSRKKMGVRGGEVGQKWYYSKVESRQRSLLAFLLLWEDLILICAVIRGRSAP